MALTKEQARVLLGKFNTGEFPGQKWATVQALVAKGMLKESGSRMVVTDAGKAWCFDHHMDLS